MKKCAFILASLLAAAAPARGQSPDTLQLEQVTVTAVKQGGDLDRMPVSATTINRTDAERNDVTGVKTAASLVPNLHLPNYGSAMTSTIYIRGIGTRIDQPAVGLNIDNIPILTKENYDFNIPDISRVEVLRGPQSTLFGRNTMGGVVNIYTLSPFNYTGTRVIGRGAFDGSHRLGASHYARIRHNLGLAVTAAYDYKKGHHHNTHTGNRIGNERQFNTRLRLEWRPDRQWQISNTLSVGHTRQNGYPYASAQTGQVAYNDTCFYRRTSLLEGLTLSYTTDRLRLTAFTSYQYLNDNMTLDQDFTAEPYFTLTQARREHAVTGEIVLKPISDKPLQWNAGVFAFYRHANMDAPVTFKDTGIRELIENHVNSATPNYPVVWDTRQFLLGSRFRMPTFGTAAYARANYQWKRFNFEAALRIDYERATLHYHSETHTGYTTLNMHAGGAPLAHENININDSGTLHKDFFQVLPKLSVTYNITDRNTLYAIISRGGKSGGFNTQMFSDVLQQRLMNTMGIGVRYDVDRIVGYRPERAWNFELGAHLNLFDNRLKINPAAFLMDTRDRQLTIFPDGTTTGRVMANAGHTRSAGVELDLTAHPWSGATLNTSYGFVDARFVEYNDNRADYRNRIVPYAPRHTLFGQILQDFTVNQYPTHLYLEVNVRAAGPIYWNEDNTAMQRFYALLGASITVSTPKYSFQLWGQNLTETRYNTFYFVSIGHAFVQRANGISAGVTIRVNI